MAAKKVAMSKEAFVKEHKELVNTLKTGSRKALNSEAKEQGAELKAVQKAGAKYGC